MIRILTIIFLMCETVLSQTTVSRFHIKDTVTDFELTRRFTNSIMDFKSPLEDGDFIVVGVVSDSIDTNKIGLHLYTYFPKNINPEQSIITIFYEDNTKDLFYPIAKPDSNNYVEYRFIMNSYSLHRKRAKKIQFRGIETYNIENQNYFIEFMKELFTFKEE